ncbi:hypothetical protein EDB92DRAFT_460242 [Lactarius akahatsu]|uniref:Uncharacterized protein n=1 Tax=Lactarius akahatsu TaxID=416441 RepID=A0AAD4QHH6_9AGAM|nr:hypothetical protein EDB92DRAFT_460242 [Lactarius akahatsu]
MQRVVLILGWSRQMLSRVTLLRALERGKDRTWSSAKITHSDRTHAAFYWRREIPVAIAFHETNEYSYFCASYSGGSGRFRSFTGSHSCLTEYSKGVGM